MPQQYARDSKSQEPDIVAERSTPEWMPKKMLQIIHQLAILLSKDLTNQALDLQPAGSAGEPRGHRTSQRHRQR